MTTKTPAIRTSCLAAILALATAQAASALTIEQVRGAERSGIPILTQEDMERFNDCGIPQFGTGGHTMPMAEQTKIFGEAQAAGVEAQIIWLRHYDAQIAHCLAGR